MKKKVSGRHIRLLLCLLMAAIFALSYQYIYVKYEDQADDYNGKAEHTRQLITQRRDELANADTLKAQTEEITKDYEEIINAYPVKLTKEDNLIFIEQLEKALKIDIPSVEIHDSSDFYKTILPARDKDGNELAVNAPASGGDNTVAQGAAEGVSEQPANEADVSGELENAGQAGEAADEASVSGTGSEGASGTDASGQQFMLAVQSQIDISFQTTNDDFLRLVDYISNYPEKTSITNAALSYDSSTGGLMASMTINRYALTGTGKEYDEPDIGKISIGTDNLFGTPSKKKAAEENNAAENNKAAEENNAE